jgi:tetratricopeptide (TPR) repeat protein
MKKVIIIILPILLIGQDPNMPENIQNIINQAKDYYDVSLFDESKSMLLKLLHSNEGKPFEAEIRYHLGLACWYSKDISDARIQWSKVIKKFPTNQRSKELNRVFSNLAHSFDSTNYFREEEFEYNSDLRTGFLFWSPTYINKKLLWGKLKDASRAKGYYQGLVKKYDDPKKKFQILYYLFLIEAGYNLNNYGYNNFPVSSGGGTGITNFGEKNTPLNNNSFVAMKLLLNEMETQITTDILDPNLNTLILAYYIAGVKVSGSSFLGIVKPDENSIPLFNKVIELTKNNENNIYRIFSQHWLNNKKKSKKKSKKKNKKNEDDGFIN